jgi:hypothetical protein
MNRNILERFQPELKDGLLNFVSLYLNKAMINGVFYVLIPDCQPQKLQDYQRIKQIADIDANLPNGAADIFKEIRVCNGLILEMPPKLLTLILKAIYKETKGRLPQNEDISAFVSGLFSDESVSGLKNSEIERFMTLVNERKDDEKRIFECVIYSVSATDTCGFTAIRDGRDVFIKREAFRLTVSDIENLNLAAFQIGEITPCADGLTLKVKIAISDISFSPTFAQADFIAWAVVVNNGKSPLSAVSRSVRTAFAASFLNI